MLRLEFIHEANRVHVDDEKGRMVAEVTFPNAKDEKDIVEIDRTFVDESLRGQGVAGQLLEHAYDEIKRQGKRARAVCPYAVRWFEQNPDKRDILR